MNKIHTIMIVLAVTLFLGLTASMASAWGNRHQPTMQLVIFPASAFSGALLF